MTKRLFIFLLIFIIPFMVLKLQKFNVESPTVDPFDFAKEKENHENYLALFEHPEEEESEEGDGEAVAKVATNEAPIELTTEELQNGYHVYTKKGQCVSCHGKGGEGKVSQESPKLAAQHDWYLEKQLIDMKSGVRSNPKMNIYLKKLTEQDMSDVAHYLSLLPRK